MPKNLKIKTKQRTGKGKITEGRAKRTVVRHDFAKSKFRFGSMVIVWKEGYQDKDDSGAWRFARVPEDISAKIKEMQKGRLRRGWGAVYAKAKIGKGEWVTSIFPDRHSDTYILPLKKQIRFEENLYDGIEIKVSIEIWF
ncbi:MAG: hypothetical protein UU10_C0024G0003 [Parcubacteria group bacterium GW2011_GWF1_40_6]|uniref:DUF1905 domain-containing protein n=2 Tax=Candidatus Nomuraibacteriota TaxID=1752729 RepID=A0A0G0QRK8_9BACT|nr:MAG: hypothetical protein UT78_C0008G0006 [Candidatus Nomurabacteria bacterium GW2011_GWF2_40_12]KKR68443.1 MAG: hypothetical protein UU10_C0024G0003 [Parcubacteria group bacterium GW2011_GWF1_40_6]